MSKIRTHYDNLKVTRNAPDVVIKAAHKALLQLHHPDKAADKVAAERITRIINEAREVLLDPRRRKQHDDWIQEKETNLSNKPSTWQDDTEVAFNNEEPTETEQQNTVQEKIIGKYMTLSNGSSIDTDTGLMWCRFVLGQTWGNGTVHGDAKAYTWLEAFDAVQAFNDQGGYLDYTDWRLPNLNELKTLLDKHIGNKEKGIYFIDQRVFPESPNWLWSSTRYAGYGGGAWFVSFKNGDAFNEDSNIARAIRLVRNNS